MNSSNALHDGQGNPWRSFLLVAFLAYVLGLALRLVEAPLWSIQALHVGGEPLLATHDAYGWLAGAQDSGRLSGRPMSLLLSFLHGTTGAPLGLIGFWLPVFAAPLVALPVCALCAYWGRAEAGMLAGLVTTGAYGYLFRTRLGYTDQDPFTLLFPLVLAAALIIHFSMLSKGSIPKERVVRFWTVTAGIGCLAWLYQWFYPNGFPVALVIIGTALAIGLWKSEGNKAVLAGSAGILFTLWLGGLYGIPVVLLWLWISRSRPAQALGTWTLLLLFGAGALAMILNGIVPQLFQAAVFKVLVYSKHVTTTGGVVSFPDRMLSVREAQSIDWARLFYRIGIHWSLFLSGALGFLLVVRSHPHALILLPLLALALFSFKLGNRFTMYGGPIIGIGAGFLLSMAAVRLRLSRVLLWSVHAAAVVIVFFAVHTTASRLNPMPVLPQPYAKAFVALGEKTPRDARLWQWWDYGYAAQYYAQRATFEDGGMQRGLYALALAHTTPSPLQANQIMKLCTKSEKEQLAVMVENGTRPHNPGGSILYYPTDPMLPLKEMGDAGKAQAFVADLARKPLPWPDDLPPQYLVFSWENLKLAYWISYFGTWDLIAGRGNPGQIQPLKGKMQIDLENGKLLNDGRETPLAGVSLISEKSTNSRTWHAADGLYLVVNSLSNEAYLMDRTIYDSMMVRMLIGDPEEFSEYFELVEDGYPWVRAYLAK
jgi:undecaprenyl-diphosphooligosaccharide---protein glycotransferase